MDSEVWDVSPTQRHALVLPNVLVLGVQAFSQVIWVLYDILRAWTPSLSTLAEVDGALMEQTPRCSLGATCSERISDLRRKQLFQRSLDKRTQYVGSHDHETVCCGLVSVEPFAQYHEYD